MISIIIQQEPIDAARVLTEAGTDADGAVVTFIGRVRNNSREKTVTHIEYEAYSEMARKQLRKIVDEAVARWSLNSCTVVHRFGPVAVGETSIIIAVSAPHRNAAFLAAQYIIDTIKVDVPIWKKEFYSDGSSWINGKE